MTAQRLCGRGLHDLNDPANRVPSSTSCRPCSNARERRQRAGLPPLPRVSPPGPPKHALCNKGLHDLTDPANRYVTGSHRKSGCLPCRKATRRERYAANPAPVIAKVNEYQQREAARVKARKHHYYRANRERLIEAERVKRAARSHEEHLRDLERGREAYQRDREKILARLTEPKARLRRKAADHRHRARKVGADMGDVDARVVEDVLASNDGMCVYCGGCPARDIDHVEPLAGGGLHAADNLLPACKPCNSSKSDRDPATWLGITCRRCGGRVTGVGRGLEVTALDGADFASLVTALWRAQHPEEEAA